MSAHLLDDPERDEVLAAVRVALAPPPGLPALPSRSEVAALERLVAARFPADRAAPRGVIVRLAEVQRQRRARNLRRVGAAAALVVLFTGSAAAADTGATRLPRPVRVAAYAVGLPVDSPALEDAQRHLRTLHAALDVGNAAAVAHAVANLREVLLRIPDDEREEAEVVVEAVATARPILTEARAGDNARIAGSGGGDDEAVPPAPLPAPAAGADQPGRDASDGSTPPGASEPASNADDEGQIEAQPAVMAPAGDGVPGGAAEGTSAADMADGE